MIDFKKFNEWSSQVYENRSFTEEKNVSYFEKGDADPRTLFECLLDSVDRNLNESLDSQEFDYVEIDNVLILSILESYTAGNDEPLNEVFDFVKKRIKDALDKSSEVVGKGIQIGADLYTSVKELGTKLKDVVSKVFEKIKKFLSLTWDWARKSLKPAVEKLKAFAKEEVKGTAISSLASLIQKNSAEAEFVEAEKDIKGAVGKINGKNYKLDPNKGVEKLKDSMDDLETADSMDMDDVVIKDLVAVTESTVDKIFTSIKGLIIEGTTLDEISNFMDSEDLNEEHSNKKGLVGWMIEAIGFALNPFSKLYEMAIKSSLNGMFTIVSSVARGGINNAYKYVIMGTIVSLAYHIIHGATAINQHFTAHEAESTLKLLDGKRMFQFEDAKKMLTVGLGGIFTHCLSSFFPIVALILEIVIVSIASFELCIAVCESSETAKSTKACTVIMKAEHALEAAF